ncbi:hypothetical protein H6B10_10595 [Gemmiger formicilis]|uniref:hypothetical protein n=1 Tax=Gemmiger formicilis TaxID=745368 RepID=UPI00195824A0|nr:hypothetical protein [Gemmiger formicilis]MBM6900153.1 hypothetical protein [Gemmiger formicilis]
MKLRERWLPLCGTALLVILCTTLPFVWFAVRDRQLDSAQWDTAADSNFLGTAGRENAVARELYYWRQQSAETVMYQPAPLSTAQETVAPCLAALRSFQVLPEAYLDAAEELVAQATECYADSETAGATTYHFSRELNGPYLSITVTEYGTLTGLNGKLGLADGFDSTRVARAYRTMLGLDSFTDWEDAEPLGHGSPAPCYSADAQLYLVANMDLGYFSVSVTSMAPETYAGL